MLYFRIHVATASKRENAFPEAVAHVLVEADGIQIGATEVVRRLHGQGWRIVDVLGARALRDGDRFRGNHPLACPLNEAEERGFAVLIETRHEIDGGTIAATTRVEASN